MLIGTSNALFLIDVLITYIFLFMHHYFFSWPFCNSNSRENWSFCNDNVIYNQPFTFRYVGLSSTGITYKSSSAAYGSSSGGFGSDDQYGSLGSSRDVDSYRDEDSYTSKGRKSSSEGLTSDNGFGRSKKGTSSR